MGASCESGELCRLRLCSGLLTFSDMVDHNLKKLRAGLRMPKACLALTWGGPCPPVVGSGLSHAQAPVPRYVTATCWASTYPFRVSQCHDA